MSTEHPSSSSDTPGSLRIDARTLPPPDGASQALRDAVAASSEGMGGRMQALSSIPQDDAGWLAFVEADNSRKVAALEPAIAAAPVSVERDEVAGVGVYHVVPDDIEPVHEEHLFVHVHGGAFVLNGGLACVGEALAIAMGTKMRAISIDYRMPPRHPYPAAVDDVVAVYRALREERRPRSMAMGGTSAGGAITLSAVQRLIELGVDVPGALFVGTPGSDLSKTGDSYYTNEGVERHLPAYDGLVDAMVHLYAAGLDLTDPRVSPVYGSFDGFPPTLLVSGTRDLLLSNTVRSHIKLREAGSKADLLVYEGMSHADYLIEGATPEGQHFMAELDRFFAKHLRSGPRRGTHEVERMRAALDMGVS